MFYLVNSFLYATKNIRFVVCYRRKYVSNKRKEGVSAHRAKKKSKCKLSKSEIMHLYTEGKSTSEIAMLANVSARYIRMVLSDNNVPRRAIGSWKRKYDITEDYFKTWSNNMAYILGFIAADGVIQKENQCVSISQKESYILEDIKRTKTNQPLYQNKNRRIYAKH